MNKNAYPTLFLAAAALALLVACGGQASSAIVVQDEPVLANAEIIFQVNLPAELGEGINLGIELLDEVTGLAFNPTRYSMEKINGRDYFVRIEAPIGSLLKYRYIKMGEIPSPEYTSENRPVRYRLFHVYGPAVQRDMIAGWIDSPFSGESGSLTGSIATASGSIVPGVVVSIDGLSTATDSEGSFRIDQIPVGTHTLTAVSRNGDYLPFQQEAVIASNAVTPANFQIIPAARVRLTFIVDVPAGEYANVPVRMAGSLAMLGNTGEDLSGGLSTPASACPSLVQLETGQYALTVEVGAGTYVEYKYTLGDGFWNSEVDGNGGFVIRKLIAPNQDATYNDKVQSWSSKASSPVTFSVNVPADTDPSQPVSIRFNPFTWTNPIPMWSLGNNQWYYTLYNPLDILSQVSYQYCLGDLCENSSGETVAVTTSSLSFFTPSTTAQSFQDTISSWK